METLGVKGIYRPVEAFHLRKLSRL